MPESPFSSRNRSEESAHGSEAGENSGRGELRLRVLNSLPVIHQRYLAEEIRKLCTFYLRLKGVPASEVTPEDLLSEIWAKLLGSVALSTDETFADPSQWSISSNAPEHDGRVVWLIKEIGGTEALAHRHQDILRQRFGRKRQFVQPADDDSFEDDPRWRPEADEVLYEIDIRRIWRGLLIAAEQQFRPDDDVSMLLRVIEAHPDIFDVASGGQWPINEIVMLLSISFRNHQWSVPRVDNAKRRLTNWVGRLMQKNGLDITELEALFARISRQKELQNSEHRTNYFPTE